MWIVQKRARLRKKQQKIISTKQEYQKNKPRCHKFRLLKIKFWPDKLYSNKILSMLWSFKTPSSKMKHIVLSCSPTRVEQRKKSDLEQILFFKLTRTARQAIHDDQFFRLEQNRNPIVMNKIFKRFFTLLCEKSLFYVLMKKYLLICEPLKFFRFGAKT